MGPAHWPQHHDPGGACEGDPGAGLRAQRLPVRVRQRGPLRADLGPAQARGAVHDRIMGGDIAADGSHTIASVAYDKTIKIWAPDEVLPDDPSGQAMT